MSTRKGTNDEWAAATMRTLYDSITRTELGREFLRELDPALREEMWSMIADDRERVAADVVIT